MIRSFLSFYGGRGIVMRLFALPVAVILLAAASFELAGCGSWLPSMDVLGGSSKAPAEPEPEGLIIYSASVALGPIKGPPQAVSDRIVRMLNAASERDGLALLNSEGAAGDYRLQGDLKAIRQGNKVKVIYRWQVFDRTGARMTNASGTETVPAVGGDPWSEIPAPTLQVIADQAIAAVGRLAKPAAPEGAASASLAKSGLSGTREVASAATDSGVQTLSGEPVFNPDEALLLVNNYRKSKGLQPLTLDNDLIVAASALAADMAENDRESHIGPNGANLSKRLKSAGYKFMLAAENVGVGQKSIAALIGEWKRDPTANRNFLIPDANQMGIAVRYRPDTKSGTYWTFVVAARREPA
jgi:uncharacterized protein YkwD